MTNRGPSTEPCGIPVVTEMVEDLWPLSTTCCSLLVKELFQSTSTHYHEYQKILTCLIDVGVEQYRRLLGNLSSLHRRNNLWA